MSSSSNEPSDNPDPMPVPGGLITGTIRFEYAGEGAFLVVNDEDQSTGYAFDTETYINEIPGAQVIYFKGGLGKDVPPTIYVPYVEADETLYSVFISGKTIDSISEGALTMTGAGYAMGLAKVHLDPDELLELAVSPDGDLIAFKASETVTAPLMYVSYDPVSKVDPSIIFAVGGVTLNANEIDMLGRISPLNAGGNRATLLDGSLATPYSHIIDAK